MFNSWSLLSLSAILQVQNAYYDYHTVYIMTTHLSGVQHDFHVTLCSCCPNSNRTGVTSGAGTAYNSCAIEF